MNKRRFLRFLGRFATDQSGATVVDWVIITAGVVAMTMAVMAFTGGSASNLSNQMSSEIADRPTQP